MTYHLNLIHRAIKLSSEGWTHREIKKELNISIGTAHLWTIDIVLNEEQRQAITERRNKYIPKPEEKENG